MQEFIIRDLNKLKKTYDASIKSRCSLLERLLEKKAPSLMIDFQLFSISETFDQWLKRGINGY